MKQFTSIFWIFVGLLVFQNAHVSAVKCVLCKFGSILPTLNLSVTKSNTDYRFNKSRNTMTLSLPNQILIKTIAEPTHSETDLLASIKTTEDLIKFSSQTSLADLSPDEKKSIVIALTSFYGLMTVPLPQPMTVNLVNMLACSPKLFSTLSRPCLNSALSILTVSRCALCEVPPKDLVLFLNGLLSLPPGTLNSIPRSSFISILGTISSPEILNDLPHSSVMNLITALSMSKSLFNCLPLPTLISLLTFTASKSPTELIITLPPSTLFGFLEGLLDTLDDSSSFLMNIIPTSVLVEILTPIMTSRTLSVMPIHVFDLLLSVIGSSQALSKALPVSNFISVFNISITSPKIVNSLNPIYMAKILTTVATCPSILDSMPSNLMCQLLDSITVNSPSSLACISAIDFSLLFGKKN